MKFVTQDYYEILNVSPGATNEEVKRAYRLVRQSFRPDSMAIHSLYAPEETEAISAKIDEAFRILSDAELARRYAKYNRSARPGTAVPRDPDVFFDLVHDLDGPSPIEQLARQVGRLSEERRRADRVVEEPVTASVRSLPPQPRYNPAPLATRETPAATGPAPEPVLGDAVDTSPAALVSPAEQPAPPTPVAAPPAAPMQVAPMQVVMPLLMDSAASVDEWDDWGSDDEELEDISVIAMIEDEDEDDLGSYDDSLESLPSSAFMAPMLGAQDDFDDAPRELRLAEASPTTVPPQREPSPITRPVAAPTVAREVPRPAISAPPRPAAQAVPMVAPRPALRIEVAPSPGRHEGTPLRPAARSGRAEPVAGRSASTPRSVPTVDPTQTPLPGAQVEQEEPQIPAGQARIAAALARQATGHRRWNRESIRTRAVGPLEIEPLGDDVLESIAMDCGGMNGAFLTVVRRELGVAVKDISERTKISVMMLRYIEADDAAELPAKVYLKGYLTQVARLLKLPVQRFVAAYLEANGIP